MPEACDGETARLKVVAHLRSGELVKGFTDALPAEDPTQLLSLDALELPARMSLKSESGKVISVSRDALKALFFVKTFEGKNTHDELRFFESHPPVEGLWVRVRFYDGEITEGVVRNSLCFLNSPGFLLKPPDPASNNQAVYVVKESLTEFRVLGVTSSF